MSSDTDDEDCKKEAVRLLDIIGLALISWAALLAVAVVVTLWLTSTSR
jgi:disulfide bond formation protein DsbB